MIYSNSLFGTNHLILLFISLVIIVVSTIYIKKKQISFNTITNIMLIIWVVSELTKIFSRMEYLILSPSGEYIIEQAMFYKMKDGFEIIQAYLPREELPFHLCSIQPLFILIIKFSKNFKVRRQLLEFIYATAIPGAIISLLLVIVDTSFKNPQFYQYMFFHAFLIVYALSIVITKEVKITYLSIVRSFVMLLILGISILWLNSILSDAGSFDPLMYVNFFFLNKPPLSNLPILNFNNGWYVYFFTLIFIAFILISIMDLPLCIKNRKAKL